MRLELQISQTRTLSMSMQTSLKLLKMNTQDLNDYLQELACTNVFVELEPPSLAYVSPFSHHRASAPRSDEPGGTDTYPQDAPISDRAADISPIRDLLLQAAALDLPHREETVITFLIRSLDENGFLSDTVEDIAEMLGAPPDIVQHCLELLQSMDPPGIGAKDPFESLALQANRLYPEDKILQAILQSHMQELADEKYTAIAKALHVPKEEVRRSCDTIRSLHPKPLNGLGGDISTSFVTPDLFVIEDGNGELEVVLNDYWLSKVTIDPFYQHMLQGDLPDRDTYTYIKEQLLEANETISFLAYRTSTLKQVAEYMVQVQRRFFLYGPGHRESLSNKQVAEALHIHDSTASRAISNKYFECKWGLFPLKELLCHSVVSQGSSLELEYDDVLTSLRDLILSEPPGRAYSDQALSDILCQRGMTISRRTVVKYRQQLGIPSSAKRNSSARPQH